MSKEKKELTVYKKDGSALYYLKFVKGGQLPGLLKSAFTSAMEAEKLMNLYYQGKLPKRMAEPIQSHEEFLQSPEQLMKAAKEEEDKQRKLRAEEDLKMAAILEEVELEHQAKVSADSEDDTKTKVSKKKTKKNSKVA